MPMIHEWIGPIMVTRFERDARGPDMPHDTRGPVDPLRVRRRYLELTRDMPQRDILGILCPFASRPWVRMVCADLHARRWKRR